MKMKFWGVVAIALFMGVYDANCNECGMLSMNGNERAKKSNRCTMLKTDANFFRAYGTGAARYHNTAKIKARMVANSELLSTIETWIKEFLNKYLNEIGQNPEEYMQVLDERGQEIIEEKVFNAVIVACDGIDGVDDDGLYSAYQTLELKRKDVFEALTKLLGADKSWVGIYDKRKAEALFKAETGKLKKRK